MNIQLNLNTKNQLPGTQPIPVGGYSGQRYGFCGMVTELHPEDNTVHVRMDTGRELSGVRVASPEWVTIDKDKDFLSGERNLPPVNTFVFCLMPTGDVSSAFVLCSLFGYQVAEHAAFKEDSEDAKHIRKKVTNSGWVFEEDNRTGTKTIKNKKEDETVKIEIDQESEGDEKATITIHGNIFTVDKDGGVQLQTDKDEKHEVKGDYSAEVKGKADIGADKDMSFKCAKTGKLDIGNSIATLGAMISDLLQAGISFKSVGSPATHTAPDFSAKCAEIKAKWGQVFK